MQHPYLKANKTLQNFEPPFCLFRRSHDLPVNDTTDCNRCPLGGEVRKRKIYKIRSTECSKKMYNKKHEKIYCRIVVLCGY